MGSRPSDPPSGTASRFRTCSTAAACGTVCRFGCKERFLGALIIVPATLLVHLGYGLLRIRGPRLRAWGMEALVLGLGVAVAGIAGQAGPVSVGMVRPPGPASQEPGTPPSAALLPSGAAPAQPVAPGATPTVPDYMKPDVEPWNSPPASQAGLKVPLRAGLTVVTAVATPDGDYESIKRITSVSDDAVSLTQSADVPAWVILPEDLWQHKATRVIKHIVSKRKALREDMRNSHVYSQLFTERAPEVGSWNDGDHQIGGGAGRSEAEGRGIDPLR